MVSAKHSLEPEDLLNFVELDGFMDDWRDLGLNDEDDKFCLQIQIMLNPRAGDVVKGTGGLRKLRFSPPSWNRGKSGALRVGYVYMPEYFAVILIIVYSKNEMDNISTAGKKAIKQEIEE